MNPHALKKHRERAGMSQADLAKAANVRPSTISRLESGDRDASITIARRIADAITSSPRGGDPGDILFDLSNPTRTTPRRRKGTQRDTA